MRTLLNEHIDAFIQNLPNMKKKYAPAIEWDFDLLCHGILHDIGEVYLCPE